MVETPDSYLKRLVRALRHAPAAERGDILALAREQLDAARADGGDAAVAAAIAGMAPPESYAAQYPPPANPPVALPYFVGVLFLASAWLLTAAMTAMPFPSDVVFRAALLLGLLSTCLAGWGYALSAQNGLRGVALGRLIMGGAVLLALGLPSPKSPGRIIDLVDEPFELDPRAVGEWLTAGFVDTPAAFSESSKIRKDGWWVRGLVLRPNGVAVWRLSQGDFEHAWTHHALLDREERTSSRYFIRQIGGKDYLFMQWKSGDYTRRGRTPKYYVLRRADGAEAAPAD